MLGAIWNDDKLMSIIAGLFSALALVLLGYACIQWLIQRPVFELKRVELMGDVERVNLIGFKANVLPKIEGTFFSANLQKVREQVEAQPWVRKAVVQRTWPSGLRIQIQGHTPLALWGETRLVNTYGEVFSANLAEVAEDQQLAVLNGPAGSELLVSKMYVSSIEKLKTLGMWPSRVELSDRYAWSIETDTGITIELGRAQENFSIEQKLDRLLAVYPKITSQVMAAVERIDLRYPRGVAVKGERLAVSKPAGASSVKLN
ncbi:cell division protein FtsQ/DivIB [Limnobacter sp. 130]|jgi:cell division protein FtsQ|uniref:cell division protein FtsQ/DivIB n=1 Tax=unclassified Limnobacter TaxID=2630203 RepID=UPI0012F427E0|nr:cell division protein FtsQ/DivIB [Limnobacter sp. 130]VWX37243.1 Cell division protein FtsQ [Limnobacter sp. 130]